MFVRRWLSSSMWRRAVWYNTQKCWDFGVYPSSGILKKLENTTFRKLDLFPSSGEGWETRTQLDSLQRANLNHWTVSETSCFLVFKNTGWRTKSETAVILSVTHHRQNSLESPTSLLEVHWLLRGFNFSVISSLKFGSDVCCIVSESNLIPHGGRKLLRFTEAYYNIKCICKGFLRCCITLRITRFLNFVHRPVY
jgi:hypothetical protein